MTGITFLDLESPDFKKQLESLDQRTREWEMKAARGECSWICADCCVTFPEGMPNACTHGHQSCTDIIQRDLRAARMTWVQRLDEVKDLDVPQNRERALRIISEAACDVKQNYTPELLAKYNDELANFVVDGRNTTILIGVIRNAFAMRKNLPAWRLLLLRIQTELLKTEGSRTASLLRGLFVDD